MKLMPRSMARAMIRMLSVSSTLGKPRCQPPTPIVETSSPVAAKRTILHVAVGKR